MGKVRHDKDSPQCQHVDRPAGRHSDVRNHCLHTNSTKSWAFTDPRLNNGYPLARSCQFQPSHDGDPIGQRRT